MPLTLVVTRDVADRYRGFLGSVMPEVAPGVYRIPLPLPNDGLRAVNVYALVRGDDLLLIDSGWAIAGARTVLDQGLAVLGAAAGDVGRILVTHVHRDHYTQAVAVRKEFGTRVTLGFGERHTLEMLTRTFPVDRSPQLSRLRACGAGPLVERLREVWMEGGHDPAEWEMPDDWIDGRTSLPLGGRELLAVPTPGHTRGHLVYADLPAGLLFAGCAWRFGPHPATLAWCAVMAVLVSLAMIDWDTTLLPDSMTLPLLWGGLLASLLGLTLPLPVAVAGAMAGYLSLWSIYWLFKLVTGKEGMGAGDFKLLAALGAWLGWQAILPIALMASVVGVLVSLPLKIAGRLGQGHPIPFGPFLAGGGLVVIFVGVDRCLGWIGLN